MQRSINYDVASVWSRPNGNSGYSQQSINNI